MPDFIRDHQNDAGPAEKASATDTAKAFLSDCYSWTKGNAVNPFINASLVSPANTAISGISRCVPNAGLSRIEPFQQASADSAGNYLCQTAAHGIGAMVPYVVAGKLAGVPLKGIGHSIGANSLAGRVIASETAAMVVGAAAVDGLREVNPGETRLGNVAGGVAAFTVFGLGNKHLVHNTKGLLPRLGSQMLVGGAAGEAQMATSSLLAGRPIEKQDFATAALQGAVSNAVLPSFQRAADRCGTRLMRTFGLSKAEIKVAGLSGPETAAAIEQTAEKIRIENVKTALERSSSGESANDKPAKAKADSTDHAAENLPPWLKKPTDGRQGLAKTLAESYNDAGKCERAPDRKLIPLLALADMVAESGAYLADEHADLIRRRADMESHLTSGVEEPVGPYLLDLGGEFENHGFNSQWRALAEDSLSLVRRKVENGNRDMAGLYLAGELLLDVNLDHADLTAADLRSCSMPTELTGATLFGARLTGRLPYEMTQVDCRSADIRNAYHSDITNGGELPRWLDVTLQNASMRNVLVRGEWQNCLLDGAKFKSVDVAGLMRNCSFTNGQIEASKFNCLMRNVDFSGSEIGKAGVSGHCRFEYINGGEPVLGILRLRPVRGVNFSNSQIRNTAFGPDYRDANFDGAKVLGKVYMLPDFAPLKALQNNES